MRPASKRRRQPMQPVVWDGKGVIRFQGNALVRYLLDHGGIDLNRLSVDMDDAPRGDWEQLAQLIGYSVGGFGELSYVRDETWDRAKGKAERLRRKEPPP